MRPIDADALPIKFDGHIVAVWKNDIDNAPTVDAVPVVRCKDCQWWGEDEQDPTGQRICTENMSYFPEDGYCSWGERREDAIK